MIKSILFNTEMVRAIQDDTKTVTRRLIKPQPPSDMPNNHNICKMPIFTNNGVKTLWYMDVAEQYPFKRMRYFEKKAPYEIGDILYVRETWCKGSLNYGEEKYYYKADGKIPHCEWHPSIHMPKEAARIFLRVTDVRVERLQGITEEQAICEGCSGVFCGSGANIGCGWEVTPVDEYIPLWNSTVKKSDLDKYGWDANPWVWVIEFESISKEEANEK